MTTDRALADAEAVLQRAMRAWRPPPRLSLSEWADEQFVLSAESAALPGRWHTLPYQRGIMDAITDPGVVEVTLMKSARVGYTLMMSAAIGYFIDQDPSSILVVQPTVDDAKNYSKETIAPMLRDVPALAAIRFRDLTDRGPKDSSNTLTHKAFPGGILSLIGANSGAGFRRVSRRVVIFDEVDAYPPSAGSEGDPIRLGTMRAQAFWNRKIVAGSTPLVAGSSRIAELFEAGDRRRYHVPCPTCGHLAPFVFRGDGGHSMHWPEGRPAEAHFVCQGGGCRIEHKDKRWMIERGSWRAEAPSRGHASFHLWAAYSYAPNASWGQIAQEFTAANASGPEALRTFVNTVLGETWTEKGEAPDWKRLYDRRESYARGTVPAGVILLTAGVDVQRDRLVWEVVGWGTDRQSWSIEAGVFPGDTAGEEPWRRVNEELLGRMWQRANGAELSVQMLAVDSGDQTQVVYNWARQHPMSRVIACKGVGTAKALIGSPSAVDVAVRGKRLARGYKVWPVGAALAKAELYGWLRLERPSAEGGEPFPAGYCHFPEYGEDFFQQITAEHLVRSVNRRTRFVTFEWQVLPGRENHWLDCRVLARAAAALCGLDRRAVVPRPAPPSPASTPGPTEVAAPPRENLSPARAKMQRPSWFGGRRGPWIRR